MADRAFTQWSPDTCGCVLQYYNDDQSYHATVAACPKHAPHGGPDHLTAVLAHNRKKNFVQNDLVARVIAKATQVDRSIPTYTDQQGVEHPLVDLQFDPNAPEGTDPVRVLIPSAQITTNQANQLQSALDTKFGVGVATVLRV